MAHFKIPSLEEIEEQETISVKKYFKPGKSNEEAEITATSVAETSKAVVEEPVENKSPVTINSKPTTSFASAFSHLQKSEFYEAPQLSSKPSNVLSSPSKNPSGAKYTLIVNKCQQGNPLLKSIKNVPWEYGEILPDYVMGQTNCAFFLSIRYHNLHPNYIHDRLKALGHLYELKVLLVLVDVTDPYPAIKELTQICMLADCTLMLAWSFDEAGKHIETFKIFENKSADLIKERQDGNTHSKLVDALTSIRSVNKTDATTLLSTFKTLKNIIEASEDELSLCPGIGPQKARKLYQAFHQPFLKASKQKK